MNGHISRVSLTVRATTNLFIKIKMKKLNLGKLKLASEEVLHRSQLAGIYGGSDSCLTRKCGSDHPGVSCCAQTTCSSLTNGHCVTN